MRKHLDEWDKEVSLKEKSIQEIEIIKNWFSKGWISEKEYLRLVNLAF